MADELRPCPRCRNPASELVYASGNDRPVPVNEPPYARFCGSCNLIGPLCPTIDSAEFWWNWLSPDEATAHQLDGPERAKEIER